MPWKISSLGRAKHAWLRAVLLLRSSQRWDSSTAHLPSAPVETSASHSRHLAQALADPYLPSATAQLIPLSWHLSLLTAKVLTL